MRSMASLFVLHITLDVHEAMIEIPYDEIKDNVRQFNKEEVQTIRHIGFTGPHESCYFTCLDDAEFFSMAQGSSNRTAIKCVPCYRDQNCVCQGGLSQHPMHNNTPLQLLTAYYPRHYAISKNNYALVHDLNVLGVN